MTLHDRMVCLCFFRKVLVAFDLHVFPQVLLVEVKETKLRLLPTEAIIWRYVLMRVIEITSDLKCYEPLIYKLFRLCFRKKTEQIHAKMLLVVNPPLTQTDRIWLKTALLSLKLISPIHPQHLPSGMSYGSFNFKTTAVRLVAIHLALVFKVRSLFIWRQRIVITNWQAGLLSLSISALLSILSKFYTLYNTDTIALNMQLIKEIKITDIGGGSSGCSGGSVERPKPSTIIPQNAGNRIFEDFNFKLFREHAAGPP